MQAMPLPQVQVGEQYAHAGATEHSEAMAAQDYKQAATWYLKAADQNILAGELHLAALYRDGGNGFPRDMAQAAAWYRKAADQGDVTAQGTLGVLYSMGQGVPQSDAEAYFWLDLAASVKGPNQEKYAANRQMIGERITADELADVQDRVAAWKAAHPRGRTPQNKFAEIRLTRAAPFRQTAPLDAARYAECMTGARISRFAFSTGILRRWFRLCPHQNAQSRHRGDQSPRLRSWPDRRS